MKFLKKCFILFSLITSNVALADYEDICDNKLESCRQSCGVGELIGRAITKNWKGKVSSNCEDDCEEKHDSCMEDAAYKSEIDILNDFAARNDLVGFMNFYHKYNDNKQQNFNHRDFLASTNFEIPGVYNKYGVDTVYGREDLTTKDGKDHPLKNYLLSLNFDYKCQLMTSNGTMFIHVNYYANLLDLDFSGLKTSDGYGKFYVPCKDDKACVHQRYKDETRDNSNARFKSYHGLPLYYNTEYKDNLIEPLKKLSSNFNNLCK